MAGRNEKYKELVEPRLETIRAWRRNGLTEAEICENLGVGHTAFARYKLKYEELRDVLKEGKEDAIAQVENAHFKRAIGFEYEESKVIKEGDEKRVETTRKYALPNVTAQIFILKNRGVDWNRGGDESNSINRDSKEVLALIEAMNALTCLSLPDKGARENDS